VINVEENFMQWVRNNSKLDFFSKWKNLATNWEIKYFSGKTEYFRKSRFSKFFNLYFRKIMLNSKFLFLVCDSHIPHQSVTDLDLCVKITIILCGSNNVLCDCVYIFVWIHFNHTKFLTQSHKNLLETTQNSVTDVAQKNFNTITQKEYPNIPDFRPKVSVIITETLCRQPFKRIFYTDFRGN
jgi:hypothetical protein